MKYENQMGGISPEQTAETNQLSKEELARLADLKNSENIASTEIQNTKETNTEKSSSEEEMNKPINLTEQLTSLEKSLTDTDADIKRISESLEKRKQELDEVRKSLGLEAPKEAYPEEIELKKLEEQRAQLEQQKSDTEMTQDLEKVLEQMSKLPATELQTIIETGKGSGGKELQTKHGKIDPEVAKNLAKAAESGAKKITKAILNTVLGVVKGILSAIYEVVSEQSAENEQEIAITPENLKS